jgi:hypothetical protein
VGPARLLWIFLILAVYLASPARARAEHANARLEVVRGPGAESCLDAPALQKSVERRLGRKVFDPVAPAELTLLVEWKVEGRWSARVELSDAQGALGSREISTEARHCSAVDDSLALVVALLVDTPPERPEPAPAPAISAEKSATPAARPAPVPTPIVLPESTLGPREPFAFDVRACALGAVALVPGIAPGVEIALGVRPPRGPWIRATVDFYAPRSRELDEDGGVRVSVRRAGLELCPLALGAGVVKLEACGALRTGQLVAEGYGFDANRESSKLFHGFALGGQALAPLGPLNALFGLSAEIPFTRDRFTARLDGVQEQTLYRAAPIAATARLGIRYQL